MEYIEFGEGRPLEIPNNFSVRELILMFPFSYATYRVVMMATHFNHMEDDDNINDIYSETVSDEWLNSFRNFLETVGPAPEDTEWAH